MDTAYLAVEGGGSKARAALEYRGSMRARFEWNGINPGDIGYREFERRLAALVGPLLRGLRREKEARAGAGSVPVSACFALAGVGRLSVRRKCRAIAERVLRRCGARGRTVVITDAGALVRTCIGRKDGVVLIAGTGSIALAVRRRAQRARVARAGGLGGRSDAGSGFRIGMDLVEHALGAKAGTEASGIARRLLCERCGMNLEDVPRAFPAAERFRVASLAPIALEAYRTGDPAARAIVGKAVNDLVDLALRAKRNGELEGPVPVWLCGGLFASPAFRRLFETRLRKAAPLAALTYVEEPLLRILDLARGAARQPTPATCRP